MNINDGIKNYSNNSPIINSKDFINHYKLAISI